VPFAERPWPRPALSADDIVAVKTVRARRIPAAREAMLPVDARGGFALIESTLGDREARAEALRCVQCTTFCDKCVEVCPNRANYTFTIRPVRWHLPVLVNSAEGVRINGREEFCIVQDRQILHVDDFCNECDNCRTFCVHQGRPYVDKPRLFLDAAGFEAEADNAFRIEGAVVRRRDGGRESRLTVAGAERIFDDGVVSVTLDAGWRLVTVKALAPWSGERSLRRAAEMAVLYEGVTGALPFLLVE
jgi:putative selenate reductase